ncbi:saccharopine dehydrogenase NADP-binding domain-containing protein [Marinicella sp. S1101]|uniref:saccharopine dehydrogenase family protein n=1 Tax=Marinicella marina TaxID=2996016 RepID=UPI002260F58B|nr:saccharopine dehydrogenase NADP-binding domain-containing protein [Marinicella marina]MCX7554738.1 saccharopine dehydrogenase NADP-binding domain-containing protein [Marinicella marina]MDJ1141446.1 saccharopine dehydrogenase NADP-binding domain-containing protein [Marinicella marina]
MSKKKWMIYGATGYSGQLIVEKAVSAGMRPVLAGRSRDKVKALAAKHNLDFQVFSIETLEKSNILIEEMDLVLNCAGPFSQTADVMMKACLKNQAHYIDITGEIDVFEAAARLDQAAKESGVVLCPGVGFDVIPTDCVAATLKTMMPDATHLALGFDSRSGFSPGTAKTSVEALPQGGKVRKDGEIVTVPLAAKTRKIDFGDGEKLAMTIPWGDVSTAYHNTQIPNIEVYIPGSPGMVKQLKRMNWFKPILGLGFVQNFLKKRVENKVKGPDEKTRAKLKTHVWGEVKNAAGESKTFRIKVNNGYEVTADGAVYVANALLGRRAGASGYHTPSMLLGADLIEKLPGTELLK